MKRILAGVTLVYGLAAVAVSPYIYKVYEYRPAPGQFVGELPEAEPGETPGSMLAKAGEALVGEEQPGAVSLGAFGGYVVFGFDHTVVNVAGQPDFKIFGNALISDLNHNGGSCEPGIVWVMADENGNGLPDDTWYQLRGSAHDRATQDFTVTYRYPEAHTPVPDKDIPAVTDTEYIPYSTSEGGSGYLQRNKEHQQSYWPEWLGSEPLTFTGTLLPANAMDINGDGSYFVLEMLEWGYADNQPNSSFPGFDIGNAVDVQGNPVNLEGIDFVKVVTGMLQTAGALGETSTEVCGAKDLHPSASVTKVDTGEVKILLSRGELQVSNPSGRLVEIHINNMEGVGLKSFTAHPGENRFPLDCGKSLLLLRTSEGRTMRLCPV